MSEIDEIKAQVDIVDLVSESVQLRRSGKNYLGFCPFHTNTRTPAFAVFPDTGMWRCFGQCNEGGDVFSFVMKKENWDFREALEYLADKAGITLTPLRPEDAQAAEEHSGLRELLEEAVVFYRHQLLNTPAGQQALAYLHGRDLTDETLEAFGIGYAPKSWQATSDHFLQKGYEAAQLVEVGLVSERESGGIYDRFRHRVIIPIRDGRGRMSGFGARILDPEDVPKFLNSPQTVLFDKSHLLYGLDRARRAIRELDQAVIVEGYLDVIALHQAGYANAVSPMGTALSEHHLRRLTRFSHRIVLALDPDAAGDQATLRGLEIARQTLDREAEPVFDARGLLGFEGRLQADIRVAALPDGLDPDEVVARSRDEWEQIIASANPVVIHVMNTLAVGKDLDDPKVKSALADQVLPLIGDVPNPVERDTYRQRLARLLKVDERSLQLPGSPASRVSRRRRPARGAAPPADPRPAQLADNSYNLEGYTLGVLLRRPDLLYQVDRRLQQKGLSRLTSDDFQHADHKQLLRLLYQSLEQDLAEPMSYALNSLPLPMMELADSVLARTGELDTSDERVLEDLLRGLRDLRRRNIRQYLEYLRFLMEAEQERGDLKATQYQQTMVKLLRELQLLDRAGH